MKYVINEARLEGDKIRVNHSAGGGCFDVPLSLHFLSAEGKELFAKKLVGKVFTPGLLNEFLADEAMAFVRKAISVNPAV